MRRGKRGVGETGASGSGGARGTRLPPFSAQEEDCLILVFKYWDIFESKKQDSVSNTLRQRLY